MKSFLPTPNSGEPNFFCWVKQFRAIATRYDKTARNFLAAFQMVAVMCWLN
jgi:transposase